MTKRFLTKKVVANFGGSFRPEGGAMGAARTIRPTLLICSFLHFVCSRQKYDILWPIWQRARWLALFGRMGSNGNLGILA